MTKDNTTSITWEVESRPHTVEIPTEELLDCESEDEMEDLILHYVEDDFAQTIQPYLVTDISELWEQLRSENE